MLIYMVTPRMQISGSTVGEIRLVDDMHTRKAIMFAEADAFISIPGGFGTLDETLEITTWQQLGFHTKPIGVLNVAGYFDHLLAFFDHATAEGFVRPASRGIVLSDSDPVALLEKLAAYEGESGWHGLGFKNEHLHGIVADFWSDFMQHRLR